MNRLRVPALAVVMVALGAACAAGERFRLDGDLTQGGLVIGQVEPGARVSFDGRRLKVSKDGAFVFGLGRDAGATATLVVRLRGGGKTTHRLAIAQGKYLVQRIDGLPPRQVSPSKQDLIRIRADNRLIVRARWRNSALPHFAAKFRWPVHGRVSGVFGSQRILNGKPRRPHAGTDIAAPAGTKVVAPAPGRVSLVHQDMYYTGKTVMLDHGQGVSSIYIHMSEIAVRDGQHVAQGEVIGKVGMTGRATGPHLHWGVTWLNVKLDPALLVGPMPAPPAN